jgi:hypothetical protein
MPTVLPQNLHRPAEHGHLHKPAGRLQLLHDRRRRFGGRTRHGSHRGVGYRGRPGGNRGVRHPVRPDDSSARTRVDHPAGDRIRCVRPLAAQTPFLALKPPDGSRAARHATGRAEDAGPGPRPTGEASPRRRYNQAGAKGGHKANQGNRLPLRCLRRLL